MNTSIENLKSSREAVMERPEAAPADTKPDWLLERDRLLAEQAQVEAYAKEYMVSERDAGLAIAARRDAARLFPRQSEELNTIEAKAAQAIEQAEGKRAALCAAAEQRRVLDWRLAENQKQIKRALERSEILRLSIEKDLAADLDGILMKEDFYSDTVGHRVAATIGEQFLLERAPALIDRLKKSLAEIQAEIRAFDQQHR